MRIVINLLLLALCALLIYLIYSNIKEPIVFEAELNKREGAVSKQLEKIRTAEEIYQRITGEYAANFDTLRSVLSTENIEIYKIIGDVDLENAVTEIETIFIKASDSIARLGISLDSLEYVPYGREGAHFTMDADTLTFQNTLVNVVEVGIAKGAYMGKYADKKYMKYNPFYNPDDLIKFGDMNSPNTSGNWKN
jgi:hypothetical protein